VTIAPYDEIADEYYEAAHKTSRNFDQATVAAMASIRKVVPLEGLILDVGAGRGRCNEYLGIAPERVVQLDSSTKMLQVSPREASALRIVHSADKLPFLDDQFPCVTSFLCDPFLGLNFLAEVHRVLQREGVFIATTPAFEWGSTLRAKLNVDLMSTRFITRNGKLVVPSVLVPISQLRQMLKHTGFLESKFSITTHKLPRGVGPVSDDILQPARELGRDPYDLEILYAVVATK
jgi:SAM-dependent methyltransferase